MNMRAASLLEPPVDVESRRLRIVLVESEDANAELVVKELLPISTEIDIVRVTSKAQMRAALASDVNADAVLCAYQMRGLDAFDALDILKASPSSAPLIVVNGGMDEGQGAECILMGAADYILDGDMGRLQHALSQALHHARAERDGRDVLRRYMSLFENLPMGVIEATEEGRILHANPAAVEIFGYPDLDSLLAVSAFDLYVDPEERRRLLGRLETEGHVPEYECRMRRPDGSEFWFSRVVHAVHVDDGSVLVWETIGRDMSERRLADQVLAESQVRLRALLAGAPVAVATLDRDCRFTFVGGNVITQLGVAPSTLVGTLVTDQLADRPEVVAVLKRALDHDLQTDVEAGGKTFHVRCGPYRLTPDGEVIGVVAVAFDNTERVEADRALRQSEDEAEERLVRRAAQQTVLLDLSRAGLEGRETAEFLSMAVNLAARGTETEFATILELRPSENRLLRVAYHGPDLETTPDPGQVGESFQVDSEQPPLPVGAFYYEARPEFRRSRWMVERGVVTTVAVGIGGPIKPYGILCVHSTVERKFSPDDLHFMELAATIIAVAVERKFEEKQRTLLLGRLVNAQEIERKTIAEDIHDDAVQVMTAANMRLEIFRRSLSDPLQVTAAQKLQETIALATGRLRNLLFELVPPDLDRYGLAAAMRGNLQQFEADNDVPWKLEAELVDEPAGQVRILLFRIFQEALVNIRKHAHATTVTASLKSVDGGVLLTLADDGRGFQDSATDPAVGHLGLASMRERAEVAGGWWRLTSKQGHGTEVSAWVPVPHDPRASRAPALEAFAVG
jgi:PAS domain S-box-containing protein